ncbi:hypothetical protein ASG87_11985 [Frateuria sp. Soil773]|uniref:sulfurtransferase n=1 Tax=Frateuria sp. Soil773 TaxID=1736407 RepID=UPI0007014832|nr:sulfurtransferase [Frateuria sp. Soil773]KRF02180.1 hypothetical protein ASG87_11985 [Frateuria sp. Soil773]
MSIVNLSAYRFVSLDGLPALRERLLERCTALALKGTILLAPEGINLFLAGAREATDAFMAWLREDPRFAGLEAKESPSDAAPFGRLRVRLKKEIITMRQPAIRPEGGRAPALAPATLRRWLDRGRDDDGREVVLLDTRNDYETDVGKFPQAVDYRLASFTGFPAAIAADLARYEGKTVVSYCTGGIRCEKAALHMQDLGMQHVYQLEGGVLKYFEDTGGAHWQGDCFVFDGRGSVDKQLLPSLSRLHGERVGASGHAGAETPSKHERLPLAGGEIAGASDHAGDEAHPEHAGMDSCASPRPSSAPRGAPSPRAGAGIPE